MVSRVTSARFVGRTAELAELRAAWHDAAAGHPSLAFVAGESGVGKTRLLTELERHAREQPAAGSDGTPAAPARVLVGDCIQLGSGEFPYAPLAAALRPLARRGDPVVEALPAATRAELARIVPGLQPAGSVVVPPAPSGPDADQARLFEALLTLLAALAEERPLLLSIEDLHWADRSTRAFLSFLSRSLCHERLLVVATYRPDELHRRHPLRPLLAEVEREARSRRVELRPLVPDELRELLADVLGGPVDDALLERLWSRSEGNPLFTEELLAADLDGRGALPPTLRDALMLRIERLPAEAQELLRLLAVGQRLGHELLADAGDTDARLLREALREAIAHHILVVDEEGRYAFRHALLREVVDDDLLPGERSELHLRLACALERRVESVGEDVDLTSAAAHHFQAAGDQPQALRAAVRAATAAERVRAHGEEAELLERALGLWSQVPDATSLADASRFDVLLRTASAHESAGDLPRAEALLDAALDEVDEAAEPRRAAAALDALARVRWSQMRSEDALEAARRGLDLLAHDRSVERARLMGRWAKFRMLQGRYREAIGDARETLVLAQEVGDAVAEFAARNALGVALASTGDPDGGARELRRAIAITEDAGREARRSNAYVNLADAMHVAGRTREALAIAREGLALTQPHTVGRAWMEASISEYALALGDWDLAARTLVPLDRRQWDTGRLNVALRRAELALARGDDDLARALLDEAEPRVEESAEPQWHGPLGIARAALETRAGDLDAAWRAVETALQRIEFCTEDVSRIAHVAWWGVRVAAQQAQQARDRHEDDAPAIARAEAMAERAEAAATEAGPIARACRLVARAELACAHGRPDAAAWHAVLEAWEALEYPYAVATTHLRLAEVHAELGDREAATTHARVALEGARRLGSRWMVDAVTGLAARARLRLEDPADGAGPGGTASAAGSPAGRGSGSANVAARAGGAAGAGATAAGAATGEGPDAPAAGPTPVEDPFGLTPRERQVLALVAEGATNREVGAQLFMAEKTASVHVSRILAKLGVRSRTEAAAVAHRLGLAGESTPAG
jgi:ATP/maltotriose-dependent transcriptional regulator MalT